MRNVLVKLAIGAAITAIGMFGADSGVGTWKYNAAKSKSTATNPVKSRTDVREETPDGGRDAGLAIIYNARGRKVDSDEALARFSKQHATDRAYRIAQVHAYRGDANAAFVWLGRAYDQKDVDLLWFKGNLAFRAFETDSRYRAFLHKMNLPE